MHLLSSLSLLYVLLVPISNDTTSKTSIFHLLFPYLFLFIILQISSFYFFLVFILGENRQFYQTVDDTVESLFECLVEQWECLKNYMKWYDFIGLFPSDINTLTQKRRRKQKKMYVVARNAIYLMFIFMFFWFYCIHTSIQHNCIRFDKQRTDKNEYHVNCLILNGLCVWMCATM